MWAVLLIYMGSLSSHRFTSSIDGSLAPSFNSTLFGDVMAAAWVQENASWDGFPSSHLGQLNSPKRNTLETTFSFFELPLKFSDQRRKLKRHVPGETGGEPPPGSLGRLDRAGWPASVRRPVRSGFLWLPFISHFQPMRKRWPGKTSRETTEKQKNYWKKSSPCFTS
jgi:hypothetical protein